MCKVATHKSLLVFDWWYFLRNSQKEHKRPLKALHRHLDEEEEEENFCSWLHLLRGACSRGETVCPGRLRANILNWKLFEGEKGFHIVLHANLHKLCRFQTENYLREREVCWLCHPHLPLPAFNAHTWTSIAYLEPRRQYYGMSSQKTY